MNEAELQETTQILQRLCSGASGAADELADRIYGELKALAVVAMRGERSDHTLQPTALVNEAFVRLIDQNQIAWQGKTHFCAVAANVMRRILISHARKRNAEKRGGKDANRIPLHEALRHSDSAVDVDLLELDELLSELERLEPRHARVIEMRFFADLSIEETAHALGVSDWTVKNDWRIARAWLAMRLQPEHQV